MSTRRSMHFRNRLAIVKEIVYGPVRSLFWAFRIGKRIVNRGAWYGDFQLPRDRTVHYNLLVGVVDLRPYFFSRRAKRVLSKVFDLEKHACWYLDRDRLLTRAHLLEHIYIALIELLIRHKGMQAAVRGITYRPWFTPFYRIYIDSPLTLKGAQALIPAGWELLQRAIRNEEVTGEEIDIIVKKIAEAELSGQDKTKRQYRDPVRVVRGRHSRLVKRYIEGLSIDEPRESIRN